MFEMKKLLIAVLLGALGAGSIAPSVAATQGHQKPAKKKTTRAKKAAAPAVAKEDPVEQDSVKWSCAENNTMWIKGDMKRDQILTVHWEGKNYKLPRQQTTTGADRFHDLATGIDLVVIPFKAMLFSDRDSARLADECKTQLMVENNAPAPTQSNALMRGKADLNSGATNPAGATASPDVAAPATPRTSTNSN
jgi:hypothetical protein